MIDDILIGPCVNGACPDCLREREPLEAFGEAMAYNQPIALSQNHTPVRALFPD